jgi:hypothetical protein
MDNETKTGAVSATCRRMLRPLIRLLIRSGVPFQEFAEIAKAVYVEVAGRDYGIKGRETNAARVAILTGLSRKEVSRIRRTRALADPPRDDNGYVTPAARVLAAWHQDPQFCDEAGHPLALPSGDDSRSIRTLLKRYGGDLPPGALLGELEQVGAVERDERGRWVVKKRYYMPAQLDPAAMERSGAVLEDLGNTINHNLFRDADTPTRFEGRATNLRVSERDVSRFREFVEGHAGELLITADDWLTRHQRNDSSRPGVTRRLGLGIYLIEDD